MTKKHILKTIELMESALSARGIASYNKIDPTSEMLLEINTLCWDMVEVGILRAYDRRDLGAAGILAFEII